MAGILGSSARTWCGAGRNGAADIDGRLPRTLLGANSNLAPRNSRLPNGQKSR